MIKLKNLINVLKWILEQSKSYILYIILILSLGSILSLFSVYRAIVSKTLIDSATSGHNSIMIKSLLSLALLIIFDIFLNSLKTVFTVKSQTMLNASIQKKIYNHILNSDWQEQTKYHSGNLSTRLTSDVDAVSNVIINSFPNIISLSILLLGSLLMLLRLEPKLAIMAIIISPLSIFISHFYGKKLKNIYKDSQEVDAKCRSFMQESMQNLLIIKTFCLEGKNTNDLEELQKNKIKLAIKRSYIGIFSNFVLHIGSWSVFFLVFYWGAKNLSQGISTFGTLTALLQLVANVQGPFHNLTATLPQLVAAIGSSERIMEILNLPIEKTFESNFNEHALRTRPTDIIFNTVDFSYKGGMPLLKNISFKINGGEVIGLIGSSGEGKTTIIRLVLSLISPDKGEISMINNGEKTNITSTTRHLISYVPQGNILFSGTIRENLLYGNLNASMKDIKEAVVSSCAWNFINDLEDKFETVVGEKGVGLSEGQVQRLAIARALLRKKPILILDEATSSLDMKSEIDILKVIQNLDYSPTCIIITHRPSALSICNRVFKLEQGSLIEVIKSTGMNLETAVEIV